jgi:hypothetical protein
MFVMLVVLVFGLKVFAVGLELGRTQFMTFVPIFHSHVLHLVSAWTYRSAVKCPSSSRFVASQAQEVSFTIPPVCKVVLVIAVTTWTGNASHLIY